MTDDPAATRAASPCPSCAAELRQLITEANRAYYELDAPVMADADWDRAFRELQDLEAAHPGAGHAGLADARASVAGPAAPCPR